MTGWQFQYWSGSAWVNFANAQVDHILEELSSVGGQEELVFVLPNTSANRAIVQALPFAQCLFGGSLIFPLANLGAVVSGLQYTASIITVTVYNVVFAKLSQASSTITQTYTNTAVGTIAAYICGLAGVSLGSMPSLSVSIKFNNANCYKAMQDLAAACGCDYWADGSGFNIGTRDSTVHTLAYVGSNSKRGLDYAKPVDQVIVYGVDLSGNAISGSAGSPGSLATFVEKKAVSAATLNNIAAFKLQALNNPSNGNSLEYLISQVAAWHPGQYVSASRADLDLVGSFIIQRITKQAVSCTVEVDAAMPQMDVNLQQQNDYAGPSGDLANYPTPGPPGATGPAGAGVTTRYSVDGSTNWHSTFTSGDVYLEVQIGSGGWSSPMKIIGSNGANGTNGTNGSNGNYFEWVFKRASSQPATPTGNSPSGWATTPPTPDGNPLWTSTAEMTAGGVLVSSWSTPIQIEGSSVQVQYSVDGSSWHSVFTAGDFFMEMRVGVSGSWSDPMRIVAENSQVYVASDNIRSENNNDGQQSTYSTDPTLLKETDFNEAVSGSVKLSVDVFSMVSATFWIYKNGDLLWSGDVSGFQGLTVDISGIEAGDQILVYGAGDQSGWGAAAEYMEFGYDPYVVINTTAVM